MLIGNAYYYRLRGGRLVKDSSFDSDIPSESVADIGETGVSEWCCANGEPYREIIAGAAVQAMAQQQGITVEQMIERACA